MGIIKNAIPFGSGFNIGAAAPIDARMRVETVNDLTTCWTGDLPAFPGMSVVVMSEAKTYVLKTTGKDAYGKPTCDPTKADNWVEVGSGAGSLAIDSFTIDAETGAIKEATDKNVGQIIYVKIKTEDYPAGPYIVTGQNSVASLTTIPAGDEDLGTAVSTLQGDVGTAKQDIGTLKDDVITLNNKFNSYYTQTEANNTFVDETEFDTYTSAHDTVHKTLNTTIGNLDEAVQAVRTELGTTTDTLNSKINEKAAQSELNELVETVGEKAAQSELNELVETVSELDQTLTGKIDGNTREINTLKDSVSSITVTGANNVYTFVDGTGKTTEISIPTDLVVTSGSVKTHKEGDDAPYENVKVGDLYIELLLNATNQPPIYIPANALVDDYTSANDYINIVGRTITFNDSKLGKYAEKDVVSKDISNAITGLDLDNKLSETITSAVTTAGSEADAKIATALSSYTNTEGLNTKLEGYVTTGSFGEYKDSIESEFSNVSGQIGSLDALVNGTGESNLTSVYTTIASLKAAVGTQPTDSADVFTTLSTLSTSVAQNATDIGLLNDSAVKTITVLGKKYDGNDVELDVAQSITNENKGTHLVNGTAVVDYVSSVQSTIYTDLNKKASISIVETMPATLESNIIYIDTANRNSPKVKVGDNTVILGESLYAPIDGYASVKEIITGENTVEYTYSGGLMSADSMEKLHNIGSIEIDTINKLIAGQI